MADDADGDPLDGGAPVQAGNDAAAGGGDAGSNDTGGTSLPGGAPAPAPAATDDGSGNGVGTPTDENGQAPSSTPVVTNTVSTTPPRPIVHPRVRIWYGHQAPWGPTELRKPGERNDQPDPTTHQLTVTWHDSWSANGCMPTCIAMVIHWWQDFHGDTRSKLIFPNGLQAGTEGPPLELNPPGTCQVLSGDTHPNSTKDASGEWSVEKSISGSSIIQGVLKTTGPAGGATPTLQYRRISLSGTADARADVIKTYLYYGPVMANIIHPGHFVVVDGFRDDKIYICDPGNIMINPKYWNAGSAKPRPAEAQHDDSRSSHSGYLVIDHKATLTGHLKKNEDGTPNDWTGRWLDQVQLIDVIYVPDPNNPDQPYYPHRDFDDDRPISQD